ncbi:MAG TPA: DUF3109 family protein [Bacteroidales bacterium]|jgi:hypothetical protein|nr:DUF3109 family protein [Bacteroidales bacterium]
MHPSIIRIGDILVSSEIITEYFSCDYEKCGGICCIVGDSGAPLEEMEGDILKAEYPNYAAWMSAEGRAQVEKKGFFEIDMDGDMVTPLIGDREECVYSRFEGSHCFCAIERAFCAGRCDFAKPISCRLYPIRVSKLSSGLTALNIHRWPICDCAFEKGKKEGIPVYKFLRNPIIFRYGEEFYSELESAASTLSARS